MLVFFYALCCVCSGNKRRWRTEIINQRWKPVRSKHSNGTDVDQNIWTVTVMTCFTLIYVFDYLLFIYFRKKQEDWQDSSKSLPNQLHALSLLRCQIHLDFSCIFMLFRVRCSILSENYSLRPKLCFFLRICHYFCHLYLFHFWKYSTAAQTRMQIMKNLNKHTNKSRCHTANKILLSCHHTQPDQSFESTINQKTVFII